MKKILLGLTIVISCLGISRVSADTIEFDYFDTTKISCSFYVTDYNYLKALGHSEQVQELYNLIIKKYNEEFSSIYPYFFISVNSVSDKNCNSISSFDKVGRISMNLYMYSEFPDSTDKLIPYTTRYMNASYDVSEATYVLPSASIDQGASAVETPFLVYEKIYNPLRYFISNFDLINKTGDTYIVTGNSNFTINPGDIIKPIFTVENAFQTNYTEINLNDYAYVALALKDYKQDPFSTSVQVKGQYCLTPVYNYGMTERKDILSGSQVERCSPYYNTYTPVRTYITNSDLNNNSIYYLKSYDTTKENYVKVDTSVFDITYITEENKDNPYVTIGGKTYPTIPYDNLTDTATKSEDEDYVSGAVEEFSFSDIFTAPLEFLKDVWNSIVNVFDLIIEFIYLLPKEVQGFLISSFYLAVAIGLLKIIL